MRISAILLNKNEEAVIGDCLESIRNLAWEIIILDGGSTDRSLDIGKEFGAKVVQQTGKDYASWRNQGKQEAQGEWLLYLDPDERITLLLKEEIKRGVEKDDPRVGAFAIPRRNFLLGRELKHGGWFPDFQIRLLRKEKLTSWVGKLHERPKFEGDLQHLKNPMIHLQPETIEPALSKSIAWSGLEAELLLEANHPPVSWWRVLRMMITTLFDRAIKKGGIIDGTEGLIESVYQAYHTMIIYLKLWEMEPRK